MTISRAYQRLRGLSGQPGFAPESVHGSRRAAGDASHGMRAGGTRHRANHPPPCSGTRPPARRGGRPGLARDRPPRRPHHPCQGDRRRRLGPVRVRAEDRRQRGHDRPRQREHPGPARAQKARQAKERKEAGAAWQNTGKVFTKEDGSWLHPETVSETFRRILATTDLPPITPRDLRHVSATLTHGAGGDIHTIKETLRHSTITLTLDTYTSLLPEVGRAVAEAAAALVPRMNRAQAPSEPS